jgi:hypothetical protein
MRDVQFYSIILILHCKSKLARDKSANQESQVISFSHNANCIAESQSIEYNESNVRNL